MIDIGQDLDLYANEAVEITKQVKDLKEITVNETEFSREFSIPANNKNNQIFGFYANIDVDSVIDPHKALPARWSFDLNVRFTGVLEIKGCTYKNGLPESYTLVFYGRVKNLAAEFGEDKLTDIDWSDYNHLLTYSNVKDSWLGNLLSGDIVYPLIDYSKGFYFTDPTLNIEGNIRNEANGILLGDLKPAIKLRAFLKTIFSNYGLTLTGTIDDTDFDTVFVQPNASSGGLIDYEEYQNNTVSVNALSGFDIPVNGDEVIAELDNEVQDVNDNWNDSTYTFTAPTTGSYTFYTFFQVFTAGSALISATNYIKVNGVIQQEQNYSNTGNLSSEVTTSRNITVSLTAGDELQLAFKENLSTAANMSVTQCSLQTVDFPTVEENATQVFLNTVPDDKVTDFLNQVLKSFRWIVVPGDNVTDWKILSEADWRSTATTRDWSTYIDLKTISYKKPTVYKNIKLTFQESESAVHTNFEEIANRRFGEVDVSTDVDFGEDELVVESPFTLWPPSIYLVLDVEGLVIDTIAFDMYKMLDIEGSSTQDKYLLFHNSSEISFTPYTYYLQDGVSVGDPTFAEQISYPVCRFYSLDGSTIAQNTDNSLAYAVETPFYGLPPLETVYKKYWQDQFYKLYAKGSRIATAIFYLPKSQFLAWELNDRIFCEGRYWVIDKLTYNTGTEQAKAELRSDDPIINRATLDSVNAGGLATFTGAVDSFSITGNNLKTIGGNNYLNTSKKALLNNKMTYTDAKTNIFNTYITNIINTLNENILTWGES
jgi:hypothetical protein